ncbi:MAG TPA: transcription antitermination factor NusB [Syntrophorhabdaceae bacterium]|nr:transcription antitermination factor NusB [Syntrophorhabdaceae bacterium]
MRATSLNIIAEVEKGGYLDHAIDRYFTDRKIPDHLHGIIYEIASGVIRWKGYLDWIASHLAKKSIKRHIRYLLWITLYQITFMKKASYHVVNEAVEYAKKMEGRYVAGFVNAILRRYIREYIEDTRDKTRDSVNVCIPQKQKSEIKRLSIIHSFPEWLIRRWHERFGQDDTEKLCAALNKVPRFAIRIDTKRMDMDHVMDYLEKKGIKTEKGRYVESSLYVDRLTPVIKDSLFKQGIIHIQDEASQLAGVALDPRQGDIILDACCGLGTKTEQIKGLEGHIRLYSMDIDMNKLISMDKEGKYIICGDVLLRPFREKLFDKILLDAPCSSTGIIRKHPEIKWRLREKDIKRHGRNQVAMLKALWGCLKDKGYLVYSVCSFEPEETWGVLDEFSRENEFIVENPLPLLFNKEYFMSLPHETDLDGFFIVRLRKP